MEMIDVLRKLQEIAETRPGLVADAVANVERTNPEVKTDEGGMSDIHIGAQEAIGEFQDEDGNLKMPKRDVVAALVKKSKELSFPDSYEYEVAARMVADEYNDAGEKMADMEPAMDSEQATDEGNAFAQAVQQAKASGLKKGDKFKVGDEEHTLRDSDFEEVNTTTMKTEDKKPVNEAVQISTDSPEEAGMMMQILKLAGMQPMGAEMPSMDPGELNKQMDAPQQEPHSHETDGDEMAAFRSLVTKPDEEKAEENFANSEKESERAEPKTMDVDTLVNVHSGGLNRQKQQVRKEYPGDNPLAVKEDSITVEDLANSFRTQYEDFKTSYQEAAKGAKPDYIDIDKDGNKTEPMKKAVKDKEEKAK
tara:strand:+ start:625 stop:1716 length:1092 start_codon:yes stop_codon:yes gene_type:complete